MHCQQWLRIINNKKQMGVEKNDLPYTGNLNGEKKRKIFIPKYDEMNPLRCYNMYKMYIGYDICMKNEGWL